MRTKWDCNTNSEQWERNQRERSEYATEAYRIKERNDWIEAHKYLIGVLLMIASILISWWFFPPIESQVQAVPTCPDGIVWTTWCECEPPLYGDDC